MQLLELGKDIGEDAFTPDLLSHMTLARYQRWANIILGAQGLADLCFLEKPVRFSLPFGTLSFVEQRERYAPLTNLLFQEAHHYVPKLVSGNELQKGKQQSSICSISIVKPSEPSSNAIVVQEVL
ncbi:MAG TPA: hypothetical protein VFY67_08930 [Pyrinomonadaceae bacterium]|nr:hypothetical protein [Pyrinomonadaceae bacterium]